MEVEHILHKLKRIEPRAEHRERLRADLMSRMPLPRRLTWRDVVFGAFQSGSAIALTVVVILLLVGGFSVAKYVQRVAGLDPQGLRAEAQAIDMQLQLTGLDYQDFGVTGGHVLSGIGANRAAARPAQSGPAGTGTATATVTTTTPSKGDAAATPPPMTVDDALKALSN